MKIASVDLFCTPNVNVKNNKPFVGDYKGTPVPADTFQKQAVNFCGLQTVIKEIAGKEIKNLNELEVSFNKLIKELLNGSDIERSPYFAYIENALKTSGFRGLLGDLRMPKSTPEINTLVERSSENGVLVLARKDNKPVLSIYNLGRHGFFSSSSSTRDMRLFFDNAELLESKQAIVEFTMNKKGHYILTQRVGEDFKETGYYASTGNKRFETICHGDCKPDTTYYNKDGSEAFFENWLHGGTPTEAIY